VIVCPTLSSHKNFVEKFKYVKIMSKTKLVQRKAFFDQKPAKREVKNSANFIEPKTIKIEMAASGNIYKVVMLGEGGVGKSCVT
jgi:hypothetical protein